MPLSEDEQRILDQIEERFLADDPEFAREVGQTTLYRHAFRNIKWGALLFLVGGVVLISTLSTSPLLAFGGFLLIFGASVFIERNARRLGKAGLNEVTNGLKSRGGIRGQLGGMGDRFRDRFGRNG